MSIVEARLQQLGIVPPPVTVPPPGVVLPFPMVNLRGTRAFVSGHGPVDAAGRVCGPFGQVGAGVGVEDAAELARHTGLAILASLRATLGDLDRIDGWLRVFGMVNSAPGFDRQPQVINGFSTLILDVFGPETGRHARSAVGVAALPFGIAVEIEAEVSVRP